MGVPGVAPLRITLFGGLQVNETVVTAYCVTIAILIFSLVVRFILLPRFKATPTGLQNVLEMSVSMVRSFSRSVLGDVGDTIAPYMLTLVYFLVFSGMLDLFGVRIPATDLNFTISIALITWILMFVYAIRYRGVKGWLKGYAAPVSFIAPFKVISDFIIPVSLSFRLFGNMFAGLMIMDMVYGALGVFAIGLPALMNIYFTLFDVAMQTFVFVILTLSYIKEKVE